MDVIFLMIHLFVGYFVITLLFDTFEYKLWPEFAVAFITVLINAYFVWYYVAEIFSWMK